MLTTEMVDAAAMHLLRIDPEHAEMLAGQDVSLENFRRSAWDGLDPAVKHGLRSAALDMLNAAVAAGGTELQGATDGGIEGAWPTTAGEFAFRWNTLSQDERELYAAAIVGMMTNGGAS